MSLTKEEISKIEKVVTNYTKEICFYKGLPITAIDIEDGSFFVNIGETFYFSEYNSNDFKFYNIIKDEDYKIDKETSIIDHTNIMDEIKGFINNLEENNLKDYMILLRDNSQYLMIFEDNFDYFSTLEGIESINNGNYKYVVLKIA